METNCISCTNIIDYAKFHFWFLLFLVTLGSGILWLIFKVSWLSLFALIALLSLLSNQFKIHICINNNKILIKKTFYGIIYSGISLEFEKIFYSETNRTFSFTGQNESLVLIFSDNLHCVFKAKNIILARQKESEFLYRKIKEIIISDPRHYSG